MTAICEHGDGFTDRLGGVASNIAGDYVSKKIGKKVGGPLGSMLGDTIGGAVGSKLGDTVFGAPSPSDALTPGFNSSQSGQDTNRPCAPYLVMGQATSQNLRL